MAQASNGDRSLGSQRRVIVQNGEDRREHGDSLAVEEPLAILVSHGPLSARQRTAISITMRTPGDDADLAAGFLFAEGVLREPGQILRIEASSAESAIRVEVHPEVSLDLHHLDRRGFTTSSCGVCGKTALDAIEAACDGPRPGGSVSPAIIHELPDRLREAQPAFSRTGGLHAAALFDLNGKLLAVREDVGRHNAVDKLIGAELRASRTPLHDRILLVSGRASFELIQKAAMAGVPIFAAIGAPSSLAVSLAERMGLTLLGFVREQRFNIYTGMERVC